MHRHKSTFNPNRTPAQKELCKKVIKNIYDNWKLDARQENSDKYFYHYSEVDSIESHGRCYVIGRKGSGKSAICEYLLNRPSKKHDVFAKKLNFKNFPFNELYGLQDNSYKAPNQYITIWKYLIYNKICEMMVLNQSVDPSIQAQLEKLFPKNDSTKLARKIKEWTDIEFGLNVLGNGGNLKIGRHVGDNYIPWIEKVDIFEDIIIQYAGDATYYIVFDELDEDYKEIEEKNENSEYLNLLTSLFKAVQDINSIFLKDGLNIRPIIFLRDDIYQQIKDSDKNKWHDFLIEIDWNAENLKKLLAFRLSKEFDFDNIKEFNFVWNLLFPKEVTYGNHYAKRISSFEYIARSTHLRPRDFVYFISACCAEAMKENKYSISASTIKKVDREFSNYLKREITDEIYPLIPEIEEVFQIISCLRKWNFKISEFENEYRKHLDDGNIKEPNIAKVLELLFKFSIIGNQDKYQPEKQYFKYSHSNMTLNKEENILVHRGLFKVLQSQ